MRNVFAGIISITVLAGLFWSSGAHAMASQRPLPPSPVSSIPLLDSVTGLDTTWMVDATPDQINSKINQGYRLLRLKLAHTSPLRFAAVFIKNAGVFSDSYAGWQPGMTQAEVEALNSTTVPRRRPIGIAPYMIGPSTSDLRFAVIFGDNTGSNQREFKVVSVSAYDRLSQSPDPSWRILSTGNVYYCVRGCKSTVVTGIAKQVSSAIYVKSQGADTVRQTYGLVALNPNTKQNLFYDDPVSLTGPQKYPVWKVSHLEVATLGNNEFFTKEERQNVFKKAYEDLEAKFAFVIYEPKKAEDYAWWAEGLGSGNPKRVHNDMSRAALSVGGRYVDIAPYQTKDGEQLYAGSLVNNETLPVTGSYSDTDDSLKPIQATVSKFLKTYGFPGASLAILKDGRLVYAKGFGYSNLGSLESSACYGNASAACVGVQPQRKLAMEMQRFRIASISKTITTLALLKMIELGVKTPSGAPLTFESNVFKDIFIPAGYPKNGKPIVYNQNILNVKIKHLLSHTSGLPSVTLNLDIANQLLTDPNLTSYPPGIEAGYHYNNVNFTLLGAIVSLLYNDSINGLYKMALSQIFYPSGISSFVPISFPTSVTDETQYYEGFSSQASSEKWGNAGEWIKSLGPIGSSFPLLGPGTWTARPMDLLKLYASIDGSRAEVGALKKTTFDTLLNSVSPASESLTNFNRFGFEMTHDPALCGGDLSQCDPMVTLTGYEHDGIIQGSTLSYAKGMPKKGIHYAIMTNSLPSWYSGTEGSWYQFLGELEASFDKVNDWHPNVDYFSGY